MQTVFYGAFVWARRALNSQKNGGLRPGHAVHLNGTGGCNGSASPTPPPAWSASGGAGAGAGGCCAGALGGAAGESKGNSPVALAEPGTASKVYHTQTFVVDAATSVLRATLPGWEAPASGVVEV
jgi:hypothetical protein